MKHDLCTMEQEYITSFNSSRTPRYGEAIRIEEHKNMYRAVKITYHVKAGEVEYITVEAEEILR